MDTTEFTTACDELDFHTLEKLCGVVGCKDKTKIREILTKVISVYSHLQEVHHIFDHLVNMLGWSNCNEDEYYSTLFDLVSISCKYRSSKLYNYFKSKIEVNRYFDCYGEVFDDLCKCGMIAEVKDIIENGSFTRSDVGECLDVAIKGNNDNGKNEELIEYLKSLLVDGDD